MHITIFTSAGQMQFASDDVHHLPESSQIKNRIGISDKFRIKVSCNPIGHFLDERNSRAPGLVNSGALAGVGQYCACGKLESETGIA